MRKKLFALSVLILVFAVTIVPTFSEQEGRNDAAVIAKKTNAEEYLWHRPHESPLWWSNFGEWRIKNPRRWIIGVSGKEESEDIARLKALDNAKKQQQNSDRHLEFSDEFLIFYKDGKYKQYLLFEELEVQTDKNKTTPPIN